MLKEGRDLLKLCRRLIAGSTWELALVPGPDEAEARARKRAADAVLDRYFDELEQSDEPKSYEALIGMIAARAAAEGKGTSDEG